MRRFQLNRVNRVSPVLEVETAGVNGGAWVSTYRGGCNTDRVNGGAGLQPIWEVATDGVNGGAWTSNYMGGCNTDRVNGGAWASTYEGGCN